MDALDTAQRTIKMMGWDATVQEIDRETWQLLRMEVFKVVRVRQASQAISGVVELTLRKGRVRVKAWQTSLYDYGLNGLGDAVRHELNRQSRRLEPVPCAG